MQPSADPPRATWFARRVWYVRRLAAMSPPELLTRVHHAARRRIDARRSQSEPIAAPLVSVFPELAARVRSLATPALLDEWRTTCDAATSGQLSWFGITWPAADPPDWQRDPQSGRSWPQSFGPHINYRHADGYGDVKWVWELNRLQYLQAVAALACAAENAEAAALVRRHIADWIASNPPWQGINWSSGIELALRATSLLIAASLVPLDVELQARLATSLAAHARFLARYPSRHSSANNHAIAEALGLLLIGLALPQHPRAPAWIAAARRRLTTPMRQLVLPDGSGAEQALAYHCFTLEMLALADRLDPLCFDVAPAARFLRALTDEAGHAPAIGDDDDSRVIWMKPGPERYALAIQSVLGAAPVVTLEPQLRHAIFGSPAAAIAEHAPFAHFPDGGLTVFRAPGAHLTFDHGPLGHLSIAAHGHADALAIWLSLHGAPVLIDAGTWGYHGAGRRRDVLRGTGAHNTLCVAGVDQSRIAGPFNWSHKAQARVLMLAPPDAVEAEHDGYRRRFGCLHRRRVERFEAGFRITDRVCGPQTRDWPVEINFLVAPGLAVAAEGEHWRIGPHLRLRHAGPLCGTVHQVEFSPAMGRLQATRRLVFGGRLSSADAACFELDF